MKDYHALLKGDEWVRFDDFTTDQQQGKPRPDVEKPPPPNAPRIDLVSPDEFTIGQRPLIEVLRERRSQRRYTEEALTLEELSFLLWATQGIREVSPDGMRYYRNVPSGGNRHPLETYLSINRVSGLEVGLYRYLPVEHQLVLLEASAEIPARVSAGLLDQTSGTKDGSPYYFIRESAVTFVWTAIPYRSEWRYGPAGPKLVAIDAGHLCQNLYLACGAIGAGMVAIGALDRKKSDAVLGVDGENEFTFYAAPVGKL